MLRKFGQLYTIHYSCNLGNNSVRLLAESDENADSKTDTKCNKTYSVLFIDPRVGHIMDILSPFISVISLSYGTSQSEMDCTLQLVCVVNIKRSHLSPSVDHPATNEAYSNGCPC